VVWHETKSLKGPKFKALTPRQRAIADYVLDGYPNKQIADALFMQVQSVKNQLRVIFEKLDVHDRIDMIVRYRKRKARHVAR